MPKTTTHCPESCARERLEHELQAERQRVKDACLRVARVEPDAEPSRYEALVSAMLDALDRPMARDAGPRSPGADVEAQPDLFDGIALESESLNTLIAQLRCLSTDDEQSSDRYRVLRNCVNGHRQRERATPVATGRQTAIDWEDLGARMDAMRERLYRSEPQDRARQERSWAVEAARPSAEC